MVPGRVEFWKEAQWEFLFHVGHMVCHTVWPLKLPPEELSTLLNSLSCIDTVKSMENKHSQSAIEKVRRYASTSDVTYLKS